MTSINKDFADYIVKRQCKSEDELMQEGVSENLIVSYKNLALDCSQVNIFTAIALIGTVFFTVLLICVSSDIKFHVPATFVCLAISSFGELVSLGVLYKVYKCKKSIKKLGIDRCTLYNIYAYSNKLDSTEK